MTQVLLVIYAHTLLAVGLGWIYFGRYRVKRPPLGVFNLWDVAVMIAGILLIPYLYLALPAWLLAGLLGLSALSVIYFCLEPVLPQRWLIWLALVGLGLSDVIALSVFGPRSAVFLAVNNGVQILAAVGITNLWAQSGLKARDTAILAGALMIYDYIFTTRLPLMDDLFRQLDGLPFAPMVAWSAGQGQWGSIGLGDLLLATLFPLVMRKAYGASAGLAGLGLILAGLLGVKLAVGSGGWPASFPVMTVLGPLMAAQYGYWRWRRGPEWTMAQYWIVEKNLSFIKAANHEPANHRSSEPQRRQEQPDRDHAAALDGLHS